MLLIDDDSGFCEVFSRASQRRGIETSFALDSTEALRIAKRERPMHTILDLKLGSASGLQLIGQLLTLRRDMQILVLTGYASVTTAVHAVKAGATNYLAKPVGVESMLAAFRDATPGGELGSPPESISLKRLEWEHIQQVLAENGGNVSATARILGMHRRTLQRQLQKRPVKR